MCIEKDSEQVAIRNSYFLHNNNNYIVLELNPHQIHISTEAAVSLFLLVCYSLELDFSGLV